MPQRAGLGAMRARSREAVGFGFTHNGQRRFRDVLWHVFAMDDRELRLTRLGVVLVSWLGSGAAGLQAWTEYYAEWASQESREIDQLGHGTEPEDDEHQD